MALYVTGLSVGLYLDQDNYMLNKLSRRAGVMHAYLYFCAIKTLLFSVHNWSLF